MAQSSKKKRRAISLSQLKLDDLIKVARFIRLYGVGRTWTKVSGRLRLPSVLPKFTHQRTIGIIGCGQFAFSTIAYFLNKATNFSIDSCYDINESAAKSFASFHRVPNIYKTADELIHSANVHTIYIASNHASHAEYACAALDAGKTVYVEKPIAVSLAQLSRLSKLAKAKPHVKICSGFNRPHSAAIQLLKKHLTSMDQPLTISCFISGHVLGPDHWYHDEKEGTRICGNVCHWLDLTIHLLSVNNLPDNWKIILTWSDPNVRDENISIALTSTRGDLVSIVLTARSEPFEGINETINVQWGNVIAKIDDFRKITIWKGSKLIRRSFWPKDAGHRAAIIQPFQSTQRPWLEIERSTLLTLHIMHMVQNGIEASEFSFSQSSRAMKSYQI